MRKCLLLACLFTFLYSASAQDTQNSTSTVIFDNDAAIEQWLKENKIPTLGIGVINHGKLQQIKVFGALKEDATAPYNTLFNVASLTKL